ncbi:adenine phosphoribosyltransferase [Pseudooceanicola sp. CBS1P-1]|uniref:Adenine phosphoribosyltransferase n=1 Tax=Pseudooceanicola albus TaxID=2692189 RepID=A0A6L7G7R2_9RHOB|nr:MULTISPECIES: phosphoribosyltransferase family protein [Pseudooceanicola]MBT9385942.1 adenine phosphoribosyltransferase [Pseudooceanicola endophyticus]MXN19637.1 adenine phosphoribosyltransferase [Pseudooceanicola albus]
MAQPPSRQVRIGTQTVTLPVVPVNADTSIILLMTIDHGVRFITRAGAELAEAFADTRPEIVATAATLGIPLGIEVSRALELDDYVVLQKTRKVHMGDALREEVRTTLTSAPGQTLYLDRRRVAALKGRRVLFVDDVISTGSSALAALRLLEQAGARIVGIGALLAEGSDWQGPLAPYRDRIRTLGEIPVLHGA